MAKRYDSEKVAQLLSAYDASGGTQKDFCREHCLGLSTLHIWLKRRKVSGVLARRRFVEIRSAPAKSHDIAAKISVGRVHVEFFEMPGPSALIEIVSGLA